MPIFVVTGGAGFIGSHLSDALLRAGHQVRVVDDLSTGRRDQVDPLAEFIRGDVADRTLMGEAVQGAAGIFHLAAIASVQRSHEDWCGTHRTNQSGTVSVLDAARAAGRIPVVYASSAAVYGNQGNRAIQEGMRAKPQAAYGVDKYGSELHAAIAFAVHRVPTLGCRFFNVYGPRQDPHSPYSGVISIFTKRILAGQIITLHGDGLQSRDFIHVSDVVRHLFQGMEMLRREPQAMVLNVCTGRSTTIRALVAALGAVTQRRPVVEYGPAREGDIRISLGDPNEAIHVLGITAEMELDAGLRTLLPAPVSASAYWAQPSMARSGRPTIAGLPTPRPYRAEVARENG
jgi:UDP-glucose 4-epimerase